MPFWACKDICKCIQNVEIWVLHIQERGRRCLKVDLCRPRALNICAWEHLMYVRQMCKQRAHNHIPRTCWPLWVAVAIYTPANLRACHHRKHYAKYAQKCQICAVWTNNIETGWMATSVRIILINWWHHPHYDGDDGDPIMLIVVMMTIDNDDDDDDDDDNNEVDDDDYDDRLIWSPLSRVRPTRHSEGPSFHSHHAGMFKLSSSSSWWR